MTKLLEHYSDVEISNGFHDPTQANESVSNAGGTRSVENLDLSLWYSLSLRGDDYIP